MWYLFAGIIQTIFAHILGLHGKLEHMQYGDNWVLYIFEVLFYALMWMLLGMYVKKEEQNRLAVMKRECSEEVYAQLTQHK